MTVKELIEVLEDFGGHLEVKVTKDDDDSLPREITGIDLSGNGYVEIEID